MKKTYIKPFIKCHTIETTELMVTSGTETLRYRNNFMDDDDIYADEDEEIL